MFVHKAKHNKRINSVPQVFQLSYLHNIESFSLADYVVTTRSVCYICLAAAIVCMVPCEGAEGIAPAHHWAYIRVLGSETLLPAGVATA